MTRLLAASGSSGAVICGQPSCRRALPGVYRMEPLSINLVPDARWLFLALGWVRREDGLWELSPRARRTRDFVAGRNPDARRRADLQNVIGLGAGPDDMIGHVAPELPSEIVCPHCGSPQRLEPFVLRVARRSRGDLDRMVIVPRGGRIE